MKMIEMKPIDSDVGLSKAVVFGDYASHIVVRKSSRLSYGYI